MQLTKHKVATINYTLTDKDKNVLDESQDGSFSYLHGANNIIPGLEQALDGKQAGEKVDRRGVARQRRRGGVLLPPRIPRLDRIGHIGIFRLEKRQLLTGPDVRHPARIQQK